MAGVVIVVGWGGLAALPTARVPDPSVTPCVADAWETFDALIGTGGARVLMLGERWPLQVPAELRFKPVDQKTLVEAVAAGRDLKVAWLQNGACAVFYPGALDADVARVQKELASADVAVRRNAVWRAGWLRDVRAVPLLVKAARDADPEMAREAMCGLRRATWSVVCACDSSVVDLLAIEVDSSDVDLRCCAIAALGEVRGAQALAPLEKAVADRNYVVRREAVAALGRVGGEKALMLVEKALTDSDYTVFSEAATALGHIGGEKASLAGFTVLGAGQLWPPFS